MVEAPYLCAFGNVLSHHVARAEDGQAKILFEPFSDSSFAATCQFFISVAASVQKKNQIFATHLVGRKGRSLVSSTLSQHAPHETGSYFSKTA